MIYHKDLPKLLADLRSPEFDLRASVLVLHDDSIDSIIQDVIIKGGGTAGDFPDDKRKFIDSLSKLALQDEKKIEQLNITTYRGFIRVVSKQYWVDIIKETPTKADSIMAVLASHKDSIIGSVRNKINNAKWEDKIDDYVQDAMIKVLEKLREGKYNGGNIVAFTSEIAFGLWRNDFRKNRPDVDPDGEYVNHISENDELSLEYELTYKDFVRAAYKAFKSMGMPCQQVLFYNRLKKYPTITYQKEIARKLGYKSTQAMTNKLKSCTDEWWIRYGDNKED